MKRKDLVLGGLAVGEGASHSPVQVQKLFFLIDRKLGKRVEGPHFSFKPYFYGPFDPDVYKELEKLADMGLVEICHEGSSRNYRLTPKGQEKGAASLDTLEPPVVDFIRKLSSAVRGMRFAELVSAIYRAYPEMRENSVFQTSQ